MDANGAHSELEFVCTVCDENLVDRPADVCDPCETDFQETLKLV